MRAQWRNDTRFTVVPPPVSGFGRRREGVRDFCLIVDLAEEPLSLRWWRGAATLSALCALVALLAPQPFEPLAASPAGRIAPAEADELRRIAISPLDSGSRTGMRMDSTALVTPLSEAPERPFVDLFVRFAAGDSLARLLERAGASPLEAATAQRLIAASLPGGIRPGTSLSIRLGQRRSGIIRPIEKIAFRAGLDRQLLISAAPDGLHLTEQRIALDDRPLRIRGRVGDGLYWALRASGVSPQAAGEYLRAIGAHIDVGADIGPDDRFDLIIANRRAPGGESEEGPLLYAAIDRTGAAPLQLVKWPSAASGEWVDAANAGRRSATLAWPVSGRISSGFGYRVHPIFRFARLHRGIDFAAGHGTPIFAAADGRVTRSGWAGGYGRQVRIVHGGGLATSYSHMSRTVAEPGSFVRQGQLIGYVGSSGLSTGPHLHYEVYRNGTPVNPLSVRFASTATIDGPELQRFKARLAQLMAIGTRG